MRIGLFPMVGDLLHPGHISALQEAKRHCDKLFVALNVNPTIDNKDKNKPIETVFERYYRLINCVFVDGVIPYEGEKDLMNLIRMTDYNVRFIGEEHQYYWTGKEYEESHGIEIIIATRSSSHHTTSLRQRIKEANDEH